MKKTLVTIIGFVLTVILTANTTLDIGSKAPEFSAKTDENKNWDLQQYLGNQNLVIYFYPAAMTPGCTKQACTYRDYSNEFAQYNAQVVGISGDNVEGLELFKMAHNLNFTLLSDYSGEIAQKYGVPTKDGSTITRQINGEEHKLQRGVTTKRWTFVINLKGEIVYIAEDANALKDAENVLEILKGL